MHKLSDQLETAPPTGIHPSDVLQTYFESQVCWGPDRIAVECSGETLSYARLNGYANQIARTLRRRGVRTGDLVGIYLEKSVRLFAAILGVLKAGAAYVPIDPKLPLDRIRDIVADSGARILVTEGALAEAIADSVSTAFLRLDRDKREIGTWLPVNVPPTDIGLTPKHLCYVIYTSGSTGRPKGVMVEHRNAATFLSTLKPVYGISATDRIYQGFSVGFDASVEEIWAALSLGGTLVVPSEALTRSPMDVAEFIKANRVTYFSTVPTFLSMIDRDLPTVRILVLGGEVCTPELVARWAKPDRRVLNTYGPTETTVVATWAECHSGEPVTIGHALPGYETLVLDQDMRPVAPGQVGELYIGGPAVARGYMNQPELTAQRFLANPLLPCDSSHQRVYRTHDLVRLTENGALQFLGRIDGQVKIRGFRVELSEIEAVLMEQPTIRAAAVKVVDAGAGRELAAYVVLEESTLLNRATIAHLLRRRLPEYMVPKYLDQLPELPLMTSGKVNRAALPSPVCPLKGADREVISPADELERVLASIWEDCLGVSPISVADDFFIDLGGHSLVAAKTISELRSRTNSSCLSVRDMYRHRTIRDFAKHLRELGICAAKQQADVEPERETLSRTTFESVHPLERWTVVTLQALGLLVFYSLAASPIAYAILMITSVIDGHIGISKAIWISTAIGFAAWPSMLILSIALKWIVIGRYKAGRYPVWSFYYFRWWPVTRFQALSWSEMFVGTPLMSVYFRAMGARVGRHVTINTSLCLTFDTIAIDDNTSIGSETQLLGYRVDDGMLVVGNLSIGKDCFVGQHCCLGLNTRLGDGARLDDMSLLADGTVMAPGEGRRGAPTMRARVAVPSLDNGHPKRRHPCLFGAIHIGLIYMMGYFLTFTALPAIFAVAAALILGGPLFGIAAAFLSVPISIVWYALAVIAVKRLCIGRIAPGIYRLESRHYVRHWFLEYLLRNTRTILLPVYATVYLPGFLRMLGAKIGRGSEISTVMHISPDLTEVGNGSFLADASLVGGARIHAGAIEIRPTKIGHKTFIGNSAIVPGGSTLGEDVLIAVMSTPPAGAQLVPDGTRWPGSPGFALPRTQADSSFAETETFAPVRRARWMRAIVDAMRILTPGLVSTGCLIAFAAYLVAGYRTVPLWAVIASVPFVALALALLAIGLTAAIKWLAIGRYEPTVKPLWCPFVWINELVNGAYESIAAPAMTPMMGTPFIAPCLRMMGCKIGKWCFIETTLFSEFDLVEVGDLTALNLGATVQTHLFEDRVLKADHLRIDEGCTVGNMAVVLYGTAMRRGAHLGPLSVLMKGETLAAFTRWTGIPCEQITTAPLEATPFAASVPAPARVEQGGQSSCVIRTTMRRPS